MKKIRERGISVTKLDVVIIFLALIASGILFYAMNRTTRLNDESQKISYDMTNLRQKSYDLQMASDYLTEQIRCFVITGDKEYLDKYFQEAKETRRRDRAIETLENSDVDQNAVSELKTAMEGSVSLMEKEYYAARLEIEANGDPIEIYPEEIQACGLTEFDKDKTPQEKHSLAVGLLFGDEYKFEKEQIADHMNSCLNKIQTYMIREEQAASDDLEVQVMLEHILTVVLIFMLIAIVILTSILLVRPLRKAVETIRSEKEIEPEGAYEVRFLAKTYNLIFRSNAEKKEKLTYEATHDPVTGLYNRRGYDYLLKNVDMETAALLLLNLDNFKEIRSEKGPETADAVLGNAAKSFLHMFRSTDYVCRVGDDAFAVIMMHADDALTELIRDKYQKICDEMGAEKEGLPAVRISAGVAFGKEGDNASSIFRVADEALYLAGKTGKSTIHFQGQ